MKNNPKLLFISLGCDKNRVDSEKMMELLQDFGFSFTDNEYEAEVIVVNSCCFIDSAKEETVETILEMSKMKEEGACRCLVMAGCMSERYSDEIKKELPEIDGIVGTSNLAKIIDVVKDCLNKTGYVFDSRLIQSKSKHSGRQIITTGGHFAYLKIADGCNRHCNYCIIPSIRGEYKSVPLKDLLDEARSLASFGVKELILVAQETTLYGTDIYGKKMLPELLRGLCGIDGLKWIRLLYAYPEEITDELLDVVAKEPKICNYIDMPVQHASDRILKLMGRRVTGKELTEKVKKIRGIIPDIVLRTTLITGFPGENDEDHRRLLDFVRDVKFDRLGVFTYSREEGTPAADMPNQISKHLKNERRDEIMRLQLEISRSNLKARIGKSIEVLIEGKIPDKNVYVGRTYMDAPDVDSCFFIKSDNDYFTGDFVTARVLDSTDYDLIGEIV